MSKYDKMSTHELVAKRADYRPSHVLHLLLSVISAGLWLPVWFFVALSHRNERNKIDQVLRSREIGRFPPCQPEPEAEPGYASSI